MCLCLHSHNCHFRVLVSYTDPPPLFYSRTSLKAYIHIIPTFFSSLSSLHLSTATETRSSDITTPWFPTLGIYYIIFLLSALVTRAPHHRSSHRVINLAFSWVKRAPPVSSPKLRSVRQSSDSGPHPAHFQILSTFQFSFFPVVSTFISLDASPLPMLPLVQDPTTKAR